MDATQVATLRHLPKDEPGLELLRRRLPALTQHCFNLLQTAQNSEQRFCHSSSIARVSNSSTQRRSRTVAPALLGENALARKENHRLSHLPAMAFSGSPWVRGEDFAEQPLHLLKQGGDNGYDSVIPIDLTRLSAGS